MDKCLLAAVCQSESAEQVFILQPPVQRAWGIGPLGSGQGTHGLGQPGLVLWRLGDDETGREDPGPTLGSAWSQLVPGCESRGQRARWLLRPPWQASRAPIAEGAGPAGQAKCFGTAAGVGALSQFSLLSLGLRHALLGYKGGEKGQYASLLPPSPESLQMAACSYSPWTDGLCVCEICEISQRVTGHTVPTCPAPRLCA